MEHGKELASPYKHPTGYLEFEKKEGRRWEMPKVVNVRKKIEFKDYLPNSIKRKFRNRTIIRAPDTEAA